MGKQLTTRQKQILIPYLLLDQAPPVIEHLDVERHLADRMGGAAQTRIVDPDPVFDTVHHAFGDLGLAGHIRLGDLLNRLIDRPVVVAGGHDQIGLCHYAVVIHMVLVNQGSARGFHDSDAHGLVCTRDGPNMRIEKLRVIDQFFDLFEREQELDQACIVGIETAQHGLAVVEPSELPDLPVGSRSAGKVANVDPRKRAYSIEAGAVSISTRFIVGELHVAPGFDGLGNYLPVPVSGQARFDNPAIGVHNPEQPVVVLETTFGGNQANEKAGEVAVGPDLVLKVVEVVLEQVNCDFGRIERLRQTLPDRIDLFGGERFTHSTGNGPGRMDGLGAQHPDDILTECSQPNAFYRKVRELLHQSDYVAGGRVALHSEQQVGRAQVEEAERVTLRVLSVIDQTAQLICRRRNPGAQNAVAGFCGCQHMTDRANTADSHSYARHFRESAPHTKLFEAAELYHMELRVGYKPCVIQLNRYLSVALNSSDRFDCYSLCHTRPSLCIRFS